MSFPVLYHSSGANAMAGTTEISSPVVVALAACVLLVCGCTNTAPRVASFDGPVCLDDSARCVSARQARLKRLQSDPKRAWVFRPEERGHYATGVKLFAYSTAKRSLSCRELAQGVRETKSARGWLGQPQRGITSEQLLRARMLNDEVGVQLGKAFKRKCPGRRVS